jgi:hypothetical protein
MHTTVEPTPCPECGHLVYPPLMAPVRHPQQSCRALTSEPTPPAATRCGCSHALHRVPSTRPRHRLEAIAVAS